MKRILKIVGVATILSALLVVSIGGAVSAAGEGGPKLQNNTQSQSQTQTQATECTCGECLCGECNQAQQGYCNEYGNAGKPVEAPYTYKYRVGQTAE